ncbi:MAG: conserved rane protein of unknown function [Chloroflexi bacterium]|nr:conserved rane protein of unknown function [Chloroflexota bacterium]
MGFLRAALVLLAIAVCAVLGGCVERRAAAPRAVEPLGPIYGSHVASQSFALEPNATLVGVDVRLATYGRARPPMRWLDRLPGGLPAGYSFLPQNAVTFRLRTPWDEERNVSVSANDIRDNVLHEFRFAPLRVSGDGERLPSSRFAMSFEISSTASGAENAITVWATPKDPLDEAATYDGQVQAARMVYALVYQQPAANLAFRAVGRSLDGSGTLSALLVIFVPGFLLASLFVSRRHYGLALQISASPAFGVAFAALVALFATLLGVRLDAPLARVGIGLGVVGIVGLEVVRAAWVRRTVTLALSQREREQTGRVSQREWTGSPVAAFAVVVVAVVAGVLLRAVALEGVAVPPGGDVYHHALITQLIVERGGLPDGYAPYAPIDSFSYHFGFHAIAAMIALVGGLSALDAVWIAGPLMTVLSVFSIYFLACVGGVGRSAAALASVVAALISPLPMILLDGGRYPQAAALIVLPVAAALALGYVRREGRSVPALVWTVVAGGLLASGLFLTHYRVALMWVALVALAVGGRWVLGQEWLQFRFPRSTRGGRGQAPPLRQKGGTGETPPPRTDGGTGQDAPLRPDAGRSSSAGGFAVETAEVAVGRPEDGRLPSAGTMLLLAVGCAGVAGVIASPWMLRLAGGFTLGVRDSGGRYGPEYFSLGRISSAIAEPAFWPLLLLGAAGVGLAITRRQALICLLGAWFLGLFAISNPHWLPIPGAGLVDAVTLVSALFVPASIAAGYLLISAHGWIARSLASQAAFASPFLRGASRESHPHSLPPPSRGRELSPPPWRGRVRVGGRVGLELGATAALVVLVGVGACWGASRLVGMVAPEDSLVGEADLEADRWIDDHLPRRDAMAAGLRVADGRRRLASFSQWPANDASTHAVSCRAGRFDRPR